MYDDDRFLGEIQDLDAKYYLFRTISEFSSQKKWATSTKMHMLASIIASVEDFLIHLTVCPVYWKHQHKKNIANI